MHVHFKSSVQLSPSSTKHATSPMREQQEDPDAFDADDGLSLEPWRDLGRRAGERSSLVDPEDSDCEDWT